MFKSAASFCSKGAPPPQWRQRHFPNPFTDCPLCNITYTNCTHKKRVQHKVQPLILSELRLSGPEGVSGPQGAPGAGGVGCPICGMPLRPADLETHYTQELEYLAKLSAALLVNQQQQRAIKSPSGGPLHPHLPGSPGIRSLGQPSPGSGLEVAPRSRWDVSCHFPYFQY